MLHGESGYQLSAIVVARAKLSAFDNLHMTWAASLLRCSCTSDRCGLQRHIVKLTKAGFHHLVLPVSSFIQLVTPKFCTAVLRSAFGHTNMLRLRADGLHRMSSLFLQAQSAEVWHVTPADSIAASLALKRHKGFAAPMSPFDSVRARIRGEQDDGAAHPSGDATSERQASQADQASTSMAASETASVPGDASLDSGRLPSASAASESAATDPRAQHWMDRHFPKAREWLQQKNIQWWLRGVQARCRWAVPCTHAGAPQPQVRIKTSAFGTQLCHCDHHHAVQAAATAVRP